jgi:hypothetical protein
VTDLPKPDPTIVIDIVIDVDVIDAERLMWM